ncbi:peptide chain release factor PrfB3, chloroplastic-like isoform X3 [Hevea brasiliensis]|uniref:peptide chain release factor PrfB3, chloroplastic-like isoform X3 n=1 Tax=Hevea brasiliensis TaxID=3981 RepID=UPI0025F587BA|nr:peptide chain release factor PrfB3, chloroplastic-like isoform X3 [Hevea brasiliensis]
MLSFLYTREFALLIPWMTRTRSTNNQLVPLPADWFLRKLKVEEAKLISQLAEVEGINYQLFKQACRASLDVNKFLDQYEMVKLLKGP